MHLCTYDGPKMGTANTHGLQSWTPFLLWWKPPKEQQLQKIKIIKSCRLVMWELKRQQSIICCAVKVVAGTAPDSVHGKMLLLYVCPSLCNWATPTRCRCGHAVDEWLHTLLLMTSESQIIRKCEHSHAVISNKCLDFNTSHSPHLHRYTEKSLERHPKLQCQKLWNFILSPLPSTLQCAFVTLWFWMGGIGNSSLHASSQSCHKNSIFPVSSEDRRSSNQQLSWLIKKNPDLLETSDVSNFIHYN